jgi:predicted DNA-binding protein
MKKSPSRVKYEKEHPTISVRVSQELKEVLEKIKGKTGNSYAEVIKAGLENAKELWEAAFLEGQNTSRIWYYCDKCGEKIPIAPKRKSHKAVIEYMGQHRWGHTACHEKNKQREF